MVDCMAEQAKATHRDLSRAMNKHAKYIANAVYRARKGKCSMEIYQAVAKAAAVVGCEPGGEPKGEVRLARLPAAPSPAAAAEQDEPGQAEALEWEDELPGDRVEGLTMAEAAKAIEATIEPAEDEFDPPEVKAMRRFLRIRDRVRGIVLELEEIERLVGPLFAAGIKAYYDRLIELLDHDNPGI